MSARLAVHPLLLLLTLPVVAQVPTAPAGLVWLEAEQAEANWELRAAAWGRSEFLSGGTWVHISIEEGKIEDTLPAGGIELKYTFRSAAGAYEVWDRVGYEFVRSPIDWRIDDGEWRTVGPEVLTTDLMELIEWNEVAWLKLGDADLTAGQHTLTLRLAKRTKPDGKPERVLYGSDVVCLYPGKFAPNGPHKPGDDWRTEQDKAAAQHVFRLPDAPAGARAEVKLAGDWEVCRYDEQEPGDVATPIEGTPATPYWRAIAVPSDKNTSRPDLLFCHRLWYRTRFEVPAGLAGRSVHLVFPENSLNTTVMVNGTLCGFDKNPFARI